ncbi:MAG: hypothetical protein E7262_07610 [Lachnospiraceae bacterium]|nr:hypothetical protein [Lachnospiraceae bacterium]
MIVVGMNLAIITTLFIVISLGLWILTEMYIYKSEKNSENKNVWLIVNVILPIMGFVIYMFLKKGRN